MKLNFDLHDLTLNEAHTEKEICKMLEKKLFELSDDMNVLSEDCTELSQTTRAQIDAFHEIIRTMANKLRVKAGQEAELIPMW